MIKMLMLFSVSIDFSKAFDVLNQDLAFPKFHKFIKNTKLAYWLYDFCTNRYQRLFWCGKFQEFKRIDLGCSQGTVGGPNIFSIFTDDLRASGEPVVVLKYADDTVILVPCYKVNPQTELLKNKIIKWS